MIQKIICFLVVFRIKSEQQIALEHGPLGLRALQPVPGVSDEQNINSVEVVDALNSNETQGLPSHLKCGMWASLVLATVFLVGKHARIFFA